VGLQAHTTVHRLGLTEAQRQRVLLAPECWGDDSRKGGGRRPACTKLVWLTAMLSHIFCIRCVIILGSMACHESGMQSCVYAARSAMHVDHPVRVP